MTSSWLHLQPISCPSECSDESQMQVPCHPLLHKRSQRVLLKPLLERLGSHQSVGNSDHSKGYSEEFLFSYALAFKPFMFCVCVCIYVGEWFKSLLAYHFFFFFWNEIHLVFDISLHQTLHCNILNISYNMWQAVSLLISPRKLAFLLLHFLRSLAYALIFISLNFSKYLENIYFISPNLPE